MKTSKLIEEITQLKAELQYYINHVPLIREEGRRQGLLEAIDKANENAYIDGNLTVNTKELEYLLTHKRKM